VVTFCSVQYGERELRIPALLANGREHIDATKPELEDRLRDLAMTIPHFDTMNSFAVHFGHLGGDRVRAVASESVHAGAQ